MNESNRLTDAEWKIMRLLWENPPLMQLTHALEEETGWSKHTVIALLKRMMEKGTVRAAEGGRAKLFYPAIERDEAICDQKSAFMNRVFDGRAFLMVSNVMERGGMSARKLDELADMVERARRSTERLRDAANDVFVRRFQASVGEAALIPALLVARRFPRKPLGSHLVYALWLLACVSHRAGGGYRLRAR